MDASDYHRAETRMHTADQRVKALQHELSAAELERDRSVADVDQYAHAATDGRPLTSRREIARRLGVTHPSVRAMVDRAAAAPAPAPGRPGPIPVMSAWRAQQYVEAGALGDLAGARVAISPLDILLESGLHPAAFADGTQINPPTMLLHGSTGETIGVDNCNAGYGGTGPSASRELLMKLGWTKADAAAVHAYRYVELGIGRGVVRAEAESIHHCGTMEYTHGVLTARLRPGPWRNYGPDGRQLREDIMGLRAWITEVLDQPDRYPWAAGERVARVYLSRDTAAARREPLGSFTPGQLQSPYSVVIEQGELQIWCAAYYATDWTELLSQEQTEVLSIAGLIPADMPTPGLLDRFLPRRRERPAYIEVSATGAATLQHEPDGRTLSPEVHYP
ncbi:hypothetical protein [Streptacidiphilus carbonis]|uniref:hypothetical protein n=1 Tax=Streptacidiphilus carbonis TaxID=105422 RepID=UPI00126A6B7E|nr:hypothetical protein [Streptacidiphilus carbonis]